MTLASHGWTARFAFTALAGLILGTSLASAQSTQPKPAEKKPSIYDRIWTPLTTWYDDTENPVVQRILFTGRFQYDWAMVDADQGEHNEANIRRVRFGPRVTLFTDYLVHVEVEINPQERDPFYVRLTDAYVAWQKNPKAVISVG